MLPPFPILTRLPPELVLEVIRHAALPQPTSEEILPQAYYSDALSLTRVSHAVRLATMPHLLHTVVLRSSLDVKLFIEAIRLQKSHRANGSRLAVDYQRLVRRLYSTECREPIVNDHPTDAIDCRPLWEITRGVETLGVNFSSLYLLCSSLAEFSGDVIPPQRRMIFAGRNRRWNPLTNTAEGLAFIAQISHLVIWDIARNIQGPGRNNNRIPAWINEIPFNHLPNLTHFAFPLVQRSRTHTKEIKTIDMAVFIILGGRHGGIAIRDLIRNYEFDNCACVPISVPYTNKEATRWEMSFLEGKDEVIWSQAERMLTATDNPQNNEVSSRN